MDWKWKRHGNRQWRVWYKESGGWEYLKQCGDYAYGRVCKAEDGHRDKMEQCPWYIVLNSLLGWEPVERLLPIQPSHLFQILSAEYQDPFQHHAHPVYSTTLNSVFRTLPRNMLAMVNSVFRTFCTNTLVYVTALDSVFRKLCVMTHIYSRAVNSVFS